MTVNLTEIDQYRRKIRMLRTQRSSQNVEGPFIKSLCLGILFPADAEIGKVLNSKREIDRMPDLRLLENCQSSPGNNLGINIPAQQQIDGSQIV